MRTNSRPIAIMQRSCSDSLLTASQMEYFISILNLIAALTGFGIEAKGIRFVPNEAVPRLARFEECTR
jgi:hypothetical protein